MELLASRHDASHNASHDQTPTPLFSVWGPLLCVAGHHGPGDHPGRTGLTPDHKAPASWAIEAPREQTQPRADTGLSRGWKLGGVRATEQAGPADTDAPDPPGKHQALWTTAPPLPVAAPDLKSRCVPAGQPATAEGQRPGSFYSSWPLPGWEAQEAGTPLATPAFCPTRCRHGLEQPAGARQCLWRPGP